MNSRSNTNGSGRDAARRVKELAAIHVQTKQLHIDRETYVMLLTRIAGVTTSADLDVAGRCKVLDELRRLGATNPAAKTQRGRAKPGTYPGKPHNFTSNAMPETITKIEAQLADMKLSWSYADAIAKRMFGIARVAWCRRQDQLAAIVAALDVEQIKRAQAAEYDRLVDVLDLTDRDVAALTAQLPKNWRRTRKAMQAVIKYLQTREIALEKTGSPQ